MSEINLEMRLVEIGFPALFMYGDRSLAKSIWEKGKNKRELEIILFEKSDALELSKFLAAEILRKYNVPLIEKNSGDILSRVYASALKNTSEDAGNNYHLNGNVWGMLYESGDPGHLGERFLYFGEAAVPYLVDLLDDNGIIFYDGSEEATVGNEYKYRVKDFAAFYLSKIRDIPVTFYRNTIKRDEEIEGLKRIINH